MKNNVEVPQICNTVMFSFSLSVTGFASMPIHCSQISYHRYSRNLSIVTFLNLFLFLFLNLKGRKKPEKLQRHKKKLDGSPNRKYLKSDVIIKKVDKKFETSIQ